MEFGSRTVSFEQITENFLLCGADGAPEAEIYTHSYLLRGGAPDRPVLFAWNGGPGCSSVFVHMGFLAPERVRTGDGPDMPQWGPYQTEPNVDWLLDACDIVLLDPAGTGWSRGFTPELQRRYYHSQTDADAAAEVMDRWLTAHGREDAPLYILGESYGTTRAALAAKSIFSNVRCAPFRHLSGLILIGTTLDDHKTPPSIAPDVLSLPTVAAVNRYHRPAGKPDAEAFWDEAERFAYDRYLRALALGASLPGHERDAVARELERLTAIPADELKKNGLHVNLFDYQYRCLADEGKSVSLNDGRLSGPAVARQAYGAGHEDVGHHRFMPAFTHAFRVWQGRAGVELDREYVQADLPASRLWDFSVDEAPLACLERAMIRNPRLRVLFCAGRYDMITTLGSLHYLLAHSALPAGRLQVRPYESGHMVYVGRENVRQLCADIRAFLNEAEV